MRPYANTYPQLMNQAAARGLTEPERLQLAEAHGLAQGLYDGLYRKYAVPFLCHGIRTASIALAESRCLDLARAALLHAAYFLHTFEGSRRRGPRRSDRRRLRERIGEPAEALIARYTDFDWTDAERLEACARNAARHPSPLRQLLLLGLANELEDQLDAAEAYADAAAPGDPKRHAAACVALAEALGHGELASELREAFEATRRADVPAALRQARSGSYQAKRLWRASPIERLGWALRRLRS